LVQKKTYTKERKQRTHRFYHGIQTIIPMYPTAEWLQ